MPSRVMIRSLLFISLLPAAHAGPGSFDGASPVEWSRRMAGSEMERRGKSLFNGGSPRARWEYTSGLFAYSLYQLGEAIGDKSMKAYGGDLIVSFVEDTGKIATYKESEYNIDMIIPGRVALERYSETREERLKLAAGHLRAQLTGHPRTSDGGFWHKQRYPWQMWLDGLYMGSPFLAEYGKTFGETAAFDDVVKQIRLMDLHAYDKASGLYFHGWDEKRVQSWADPETGRSKCFWGRGIGWYAMALVDCLESLPASHAQPVKEILGRLAAGVARHQDEKSGLWWQVLDQPGREGNYLEASASAMFVYALAKAVNQGHLPRDVYQPVVLKGYDGLIRECIRKEADGKISLIRCCEVAGLGFTTAKGRPRDGTFEYYISEPVVDNDLKGIGPFILAGIEVGKPDPSSP